jgi:hypothetical protein
MNLSNSPGSARNRPHPKESPETATEKPLLSAYGRTCGVLTRFDEINKDLKDALADLDRARNDLNSAQLANLIEAEKHLNKASRVSSTKMPRGHLKAAKDALNRLIK